MNIAEVLCRHAALRPDAQAFIDIHHGAIRRLSFSDLEKESGRAAALLGKAGLRAGDGLLVFHAMSQELYTVLDRGIPAGRHSDVPRSCNRRLAHRAMLRLVASKGSGGKRKGAYVAIHVACTSSDSSEVFDWHARARRDFLGPRRFPLPCNSNVRRHD